MFIPNSIIEYFHNPYGSKYLHKTYLGYDLGGQPYLLRTCLDPYWIRMEQNVAIKLLFCSWYLNRPKHAGTVEGRAPLPTEPDIGHGFTMCIGVRYTTSMIHSYSPKYQSHLLHV